MRTGGVVLAGGRSSRMGTAKAALEWHGSTLLRRVCGLVGRAVEGPVVVVAAPGQDLPSLPGAVAVVRDAREGRGPLEGLAAGLEALAGSVEAVFVSATDVPHLQPAFASRVLAALGEGTEVALPVARGFPQPLAAAYRTRLAPLVRELLAGDRLRPAQLFEACEVARLDERALLADPLLAARDPELRSLVNLNSQAEYQAARRAPPPAVKIGPATVRAATLGAAAAALGLDLTAGMAARVDGREVEPDPELPLADGDAVELG